jgi:hypothetical protein
VNVSATRTAVWPFVTPWVTSVGFRSATPVAARISSIHSSSDTFSW